MLTFESSMLLRLNRSREATRTTGTAAGLRINDGNPLFSGGEDSAILKWRHRSLSPGCEDPLCVLCGACTGGELRVPGLPSGSVALNESERAQWLHDHTGAWKIAFIERDEASFKGLRTITGQLRELMDVAPMNDAVIVANQSSPSQGSISFSGIKHVRYKKRGIPYNVTTKVNLDPYRTVDGRLTLDSVGALCVVRDTGAEMELAATVGGRFLLSRASVAAVVAPAAEQMQRGADDVEEKLKQLKRMHDSALLSDEEFAAKKVELLARL